MSSGLPVAKEEAAGQENRESLPPDQQRSGPSEDIGGSGMEDGCTEPILVTSNVGDEAFKEGKLGKLELVVSSSSSGVSSSTAKVSTSFTMVDHVTSSDHSVDNDAAVIAEIMELENRNLATGSNLSKNQQLQEHVTRPTASITSGDTSTTGNTSINVNNSGIGGGSYMQSMQSSYPVTSDYQGKEVEDMDEEFDSRDLPGEPSSALILNQAYQELMEKVVASVEATLSHVRDQQRVIQMNLDDGGNSYLKRKQQKVPVLYYMPPYFKDFSNMAPPPNKDVLEKKRRGEYNPLVQPPKKWTKAECEKLKKAVKDAVIFANTQTLRARKEVLSDKLVQLQCAAAQKNKIKELQSDIKRIEKRIATVKKTPDPELFLAETSEVDWVSIANTTFQGAREAIECQLIWEQELSPTWSQTKWTSGEENRLKCLVEERKMTDWELIAEELNTKRSAFQCFERYQSKLNRSMSNGFFVLENSIVLVAYYMDGRTRTQVISRWQRTLDPKVRRGRWSEEEDLLLMVAVHKFGARDWYKVAEMVPGRTDAQCRERWCSALDRSVKLGEWTDEEDDILEFGVRQFGKGEWAKISKLLIGRPPGACRQRLRTLEREKRGGGKRKKRKRSYSSSDTDDDPDLEELERAGGRASPKKEVEDSVNQPVLEPTNPNSERLDRIMERKRRVREKFRELVGQDMESMLPSGEDAVENYLDSIKDDVLRHLIRSKLSRIYGRFDDKLNHIWSKDGRKKRKPVEAVPMKSKEDVERKQKEELEQNLKVLVKRIKEKALEEALEIRKEGIMLMTKDLYKEWLSNVEKQKEGEEEKPFPPTSCTLQAFQFLIEQKNALENKAATLYNTASCASGLKKYNTDTGSARSPKSNKSVMKMWMGSGCPTSSGGRSGRRKNSEETREETSALKETVMEIQRSKAFKNLQKHFDAVFLWSAALSEIDSHPEDEGDADVDLNNVIHS